MPLKLICFLLLMTTPFATPPIIPQPQEIVSREGSFCLKKPRIWLRPYNEQMRELAETLVAELVLEEALIEEGQGDEEGLHLVLAGEGTDESYFLSVTPKKVVLRSPGASGVFWGIQTLKQLGSDGMICCVEIKDQPRFSYRGLHLDVSRHMFPVEFIKKYLDLMAFYKLNRFHWHLSDDQGWRIEIKNHPLLQKIAAFRKETVINSKEEELFDGTCYGGFYTQDEIREIVEYARKRHIMIIPEIDVPGHSLAMLAAYPELGCTKGPYEVGTHWMISEDILCAGQEKTFSFLEEVFTEVMELFPGPFIHIGGDEVPKKRWHECSACQARMKQEGLGDEEQLQSYFIKRLEKFIMAHGRSIIGWDEILQGGVSEHATVMAWTRTGKSALEAARLGNKVIMCPQKPLYFDHYQSKAESEPLAIGGYNPLKKVYLYEPIPEGLSADEAKYIMGVQGNVWTEFMETSRQVEYMVYPRALALAEVAWSTHKDFEDFVERLKTHFSHLERQDVNVAQAAFLECIEPAPQPVQP